MAVLERSRGLRNALKGCGTNEPGSERVVRGVELWLGTGNGSRGF